MSYTTITATNVGLAGGADTPMPIDGSIRITPRFPAAATTSGIIATGPIVVEVTGGAMPETRIPAQEDATALIEFHLYDREAGPVRLPSTEVPLEPDSTISLRDYLPAGVDRSTGTTITRGPRGYGITAITAAEGVVTVLWEDGDVEIPIPTAALATPTNDGLMPADTMETISPLRDGETSSWRVLDAGGQIAFEVDEQGRTHIHDQATGGAGITELHVFVAAGQSNMKGHAQPYGGELDPPDPRIMQYGVTRRVIETATVPLDFYPDPVGISPATFFAREYLLHQPPHVGVLLVPCAMGGTGFNDGSGTGGTWDDRQVTDGVVDLYNESVAQTLETLEAAGGGATLKGILWHQGESDQNRWEAYEEQLDRLIANYRDDLGDPDLPFLIGQMTQEGFDVHPDKLKVDAAHQGTPARLRHTGFAPSKRGGTNYTDTTHFSRAGVEQVGREYVAAYHRALANYPGFGPQQPRNVRGSFVNGTLAVEWDQQPRRVTGYKVEYRIDWGTWVEATRTHPMNLAETISGLTGVAAEVRVTCMNLTQEQTQHFPTLIPHFHL